MKTMHHVEDAEKTDDGLTHDKEQEQKEMDANPFSAE